MQTLDRTQGESFFLGLGDEAARNMTLGELLDTETLEIKVTSVKAGQVRLTINIPKAISIIPAELAEKRHDSDFPPHRPIQRGD